MDVTLQYFEDCPNWLLADASLRRLARELGDVTLRYEKIETIADAERAGFRGSPTVLVDGVDPFADETAPVGLACRVYRTPRGPAGSPTLEQLRAALADAAVRRRTS